MPKSLRIALLATTAAVGVLAAQATSCVSASPAVAAAQRARTVKPVLRGLIDRQGAPSVRALPYVHAYVVKVTWAQLQPSAGGRIVAGNPVDAAIIRVRHGAFARTRVALKLRVLAGINAPAWAKRLGGSPIPYTDVQDGAAHGTIGRFWTSAYEHAYARLQRLLAAKYDAVPEIREVTVSGCTTIFDEPFVRQPGNAHNVRNLKAAGYSMRADKACIHDAILAHQVWARTTSDLDISPFPNALDAGAPHDLNFSISMMRFCRAQLGKRCGIENNGLASGKLTNKTFRRMYKIMAANGSPLVLQTATASRIGNAQQALQYAVAMGANSVELPHGYPRWSAAMLVRINRGLVANRTR
jgi:hypothetical protein